MKVSYIKNNRCDDVYVNRWRHLYDYLNTCLRKSTSEIGLELLLIFFTFIYLFMKTIVQEHTLSLDCAFAGRLNYVVKFVCHAFLPPALFWVHRSLQNGNCLFSSASLSLVGDNSLVHECRIMLSYI